MRIYMASRFGRREELRGYIPLIEEAGHTSCARWLVEETSMEGMPPETRRQFAIMDMEDVSKCDILISFTEKSADTAGAGRGGRQVEYGAALAWEKDVIVVGPREHLFHYLPNVPRLNTIKEALDWIEEQS